MLTLYNAFGVPDGVGALPRVRRDRRLRRPTRRPWALEYNRFAVKKGWHHNPSHRTQVEIDIGAEKHYGFRPWKPIEGRSRSVKSRTNYASDLTDRQWQLICHWLPRKSHRARKPICRRWIINAILYVTRSGVPMADAASRFPELEHGLRNLLALEKRWHVGKGA